jgi:hypothetical protein
MSSISPRLPSVALGFLLVGSLSAQMAGTYTIDPNGSGSRNFTDLQNAAYQVFVQGVSGPVVFEMAAGDYSITDQFYLAPVTGASAKNTITFKSKTLHSARILSTIQIQEYGPSFPVSWYVFDGLEFAMPTTISSSPIGLHVGGHCTDIEVKNCRFVKSKMLVSGTLNDQVQRWDVHHNVFTGGISSSNLACRFEGAQGIDIHHNEFDMDGLGGVAITLRNSNNTHLRSRIYNNLIHGKSFRSGNSATVKGIMAGFARAVDIYHNTVVVRSVNGSGQSIGASLCLELGGVFGRDSRAGNNILISEDRVHCAQYFTTQPFGVHTDNNLYQTQEPGGQVANNQTLAVWQKNSGLDKASMQANPQFVGSSGTSTADFRLKPTSPAIGKAVNTPAYITDDFFGNPRSSNATIGAIEYIPPSTFTPYGSGCAGTGGKVPAIGMSGDLKFGSTNFLVTLSNAKGGTGVSAFFALGPTKTNLSLGGGCTLLVTPQLLILLPVSGLPGAGNGSSSIKLLVPNDPKYKGRVAHAQWGGIDPAAPGIGIAFSNAATIKL